MRSAYGRSEISELMRTTGWKRTKLFRHLREHAETEPGDHAELVSPIVAWCAASKPTAPAWP
jgi:hypothetical protein